MEVPFRGPIFFFVFAGAALQHANNQFVAVQQMILAAASSALSLAGISRVPHTCFLGWSDHGEQEKWGGSSAIYDASTSL